ncbi:MAG: hypothetical protein EHM54_00555 [Nitrospiraceae bacterium]|nr:MAG: hypothetical protein EHM54_00555 [Nitrospiraceae bacterium]
MKRERRLARIIAIVVLGLLIALPAITGAKTTDTVTIKFAIFAANKGKWRVSGSAGPGNTVTVKLGRSVVGTSDPAGSNGRWKVFVSGSAVVAGPGDSVTATSIGGGTATQAVLIR